jgi:hypothetical protein
MKKFFVIISILGSVYAGSVSAQSKTPSAVTGSFHTNFSDARDESWTTVKGLYRVDFTLENEKVAAFFNEGGDLVASSRPVTLTQIPLSLKSDLKKNYTDFSVSSLIEVNKEDGIIYYATVRNDKNQIKLESTSSGDWVKVF